MKCQGGNKYALSITVKFDQSTRRFGRISFACLFKFTKHIALLFYLLSPYLLLCLRGSRNVRTNMHIIKTIMKFCARALKHRLPYGVFRRRWDSNSVSLVCAALQRPIISKCQHSAGWLVGCFGLNGPLRQYFSLYRAVSQREGERKEK